LKHPTITIFEDYYNSFPDHNEHLTGLKVLEEIVGKKNFSLQYDGTIQVKHFVGFFQHGHTRIQILPKIYAPTHQDSQTSKEEKESLKFIYRLLLWSDFWKIKKLSPQLQGLENEDLLEIFIRIFIIQFKEIFRKRVLSEYIQIEENLHFIKGKIQFPETIRRNPVLRHRHFIRYDDYSVDNPLNRVFKGILFLLLKKTRNARNKQLLASGLSFLQDVRLITLTSYSFKTIKFNRLNQHLEPLFRLATLFFQNQQPSLTEGKENTFCFLVPLYRLFEEFIGKLLVELNQTDLTFQYHQPKKYLAKKGDQEVFELKPDFTAYAGGKCVCILDAKYKNPRRHNSEVKIATSDLYQLCTYSMRYNCNQLVLIYPRFKSAFNYPAVTDFEIQGWEEGVNLRVVEVDILEEELEGIVLDLNKKIVH